MGAGPEKSQGAEAFTRVGDLLYRKSQRARPLLSYALLATLPLIPSMFDRTITSLCRALKFECDFTILNRSMRFHVHSNLEAFRYHGGFAHELRVSENLLRLTPEGCIFFDIGCSFGWYSVLLAKKCKRIIAFDPYDRSSLENVALNNIRSFELREVFLSDHCEERDGVCSRTLDSLIEGGECPCPDVLKIDVEGEEYRVLCGGGRMFSQRPPALVVVETHSRSCFSHCLRFLHSVGYDVFHLGCPKIDLGGDIYPLSFELNGGGLSTTSETRMLLGMRPAR